MDFQRIDTLIADAGFTPKKTLGTLDTTATPWSVAAKLGRYVLSDVSVDRDSMADDAAAKLCFHNHSILPPSDAQPARRDCRGWPHPLLRRFFSILQAGDIFLQGGGCESWAAQIQRPQFTTYAIIWSYLATKGAFHSS